MSRTRVEYCERNISSSKFKLDTPGFYFGFGFSNDNMDFAGVIPSSDLPVLVNEVKDIGASVKMTKWWKDDEPLSNKVEYLNKSCKIT
jgi:hypothetical protein